MNNGKSISPLINNEKNTFTQELNWNQIKWKQVQQKVNRLQSRIARATMEENWKLVKYLQRVLVNSFYAKLLAVRKVSQENQGKKTPGIDGILWDTPAKRMKATLSLNPKGYKAKRLKRILIDKKNGKKRPLGIPTMNDRAIQALYAMALDPISEVKADKNSFGFRKGRSAHDAMAKAFSVLSTKRSAQWILEGDIKGCFDHINHDWLLKNIPMDKKVLKQFLKAGFVYKKELFPTDEGTPQGGIISPILANMTLDGIETIIKKRYWSNLKGTIDYRHNKHKVNFVRYADDFIVTADSEETAKEIKHLIQSFLTERGLILSEDKTVITHIDKGFNFLGWNFRKYNGVLLIKPSKDSIKSISQKIRDIIKNYDGKKQEHLIEKLNPIIQGWCNYHQAVVSTETFDKVETDMFWALWRWAKRRHKHRSKKWIKNRYWQTVNGRSWTFTTNGQTLRRPGDTHIVRHTAIQTEQNPYLPEGRAYFQERKFQLGMKKLSGKFKKVWFNQKGLCYFCGLSINSTDDRDVHHKIRRVDGGTDEITNLAYVHRYCHQAHHSQDTRQ
ncbi:group II intron reverse transcriptase/maturase (plasmid) [Aneurinibacillus sp. Ricciae_BoGa-3]|uniref:group II intron reverse transcriptase/maturase n=1 Tax=Aneurinibacillus sp. Ricciae_BoGa-3 TaxID=3022697 RepID=UPI002341764B|nr:group II intron reverse transcriptase/maturase [Aneurinibacillus sp. Ricciae_BoGa-3]WCK57550.1 group II intron reverse transcriptase/maturase [Aneurinibacillus sp. Ricciae_BoGa-3]